LPGMPAPPVHSDLSTILSSDARVKQLATGFFNISGAAVDPAGRLYFVDAHWQRIYRWSPQKSEAVVVRDNPIDPINLAFDRAGNLMVVSYQGNGTVYAFRPSSPETEMTLLKPQPALARIGMTAFLPVDVWASPDLSIQTPWQYLSPDGSAFIPAGDDFVKGQTRWGTKLANVLHAFGLETVVPGHPVYITDQSDHKTYKVDVKPDGTIGAVTLFAEDGGQAVAQDESGNVYLAAEQVNVYSAAGKLLGRIDVPERPIDLVFGGADRRILYILTHGSLYAIQTKTPGI
jgi:sugar lactone lactonase YvrE